MAWTDRLGPAAYISPGGRRFAFSYENVSRTVNKKTSAFQFPGVDGSFIQDLGREGRQYPIRAFFSGPDYDIAAAAFESALLERGRGRLEHPLYGVITVVPFGTITRRDDLKTAANQAVIELVFFEALELVYPQSDGDLAGLTNAAISAANTAGAADFAAGLNIELVADREGFLDTVNSIVSDIETQMQPIFDLQADAQRSFNRVQRSINRGVSVLVDQPLTLAAQFQQLIEAPARIVSDINARLDAYGNLARMITGYTAPAAPDQNDLNTFRINDLVANAAVVASVVSVVNNRFETQPVALAAADTLLTQLDTIVTWRERTFNELAARTTGGRASVDTGGAYQGTQQAVAIGAQYLVDVSFTVPQERRIVIDRDRTIIDLAGEIYRRVDNEILDFLINTNQLTGSEILQLRRGQSVVYYV